MPPRESLGLPASRVRPKWGARGQVKPSAIDPRGFRPGAKGDGEYLFFGGGGGKRSGRDVT